MNKLEEWDMRSFREPPAPLLILAGVFAVLPLWSLTFLDTPWAVYAASGARDAALVSFTYWVAPLAICATIMLRNFLALPLFALECLALLYHSIESHENSAPGLQTLRFVLLGSMALIGVFLINKDVIYPFLARSNRFWRGATRFYENSGAVLKDPRSGEEIPLILQDCSLTGLGLVGDAVRLESVVRDLATGQKVEVLVGRKAQREELVAELVWTRRVGPLFHIGLRTSDVAAMQRYMRSWHFFSEKRLSARISRHWASSRVRRTVLALWAFNLAGVLAVPACGTDGLNQRSHSNGSEGDDFAFTPSGVPSPSSTPSACTRACDAECIYQGEIYKCRTQAQSLANTQCALDSADSARAVAQMNFDSIVGPAETKAAELREELRQLQDELARAEETKGRYCGSQPPAQWVCMADNQLLKDNRMKRPIYSYALKGIAATVPCGSLLLAGYEMVASPNLDTTSEASYQIYSKLAGVKKLPLGVDPTDSVCENAKNVVKECSKIILKNTTNLAAHCEKFEGSKVLTCLEANPITIAIGWTWAIGEGLFDWWSANSCPAPGTWSKVADACQANGPFDSLLQDIRTAISNGNHEAIASQLDAMAADARQKLASAEAVYQAALAARDAAKLRHEACLDRAAEDALIKVRYQFSCKDDPNDAGPKPRPKDSPQPSPTSTGAPSSTSGDDADATEWRSLREMALEWTESLLVPTAYAATPTPTPTPTSKIQCKQHQCGMWLKKKEMIYCGACPPGWYCKGIALKNHDGSLSGGTQVFPTSDPTEGLCAVDPNVEDDSCRQLAVCSEPGHYFKPNPAVPSGTIDCWATRIGAGMEPKSGEITDQAAFDAAWAACFPDYDPPVASPTPKPTVTP